MYTVFSPLFLTDDIILAVSAPSSSIVAIIILIIIIYMRKSRTVMNETATPLQELNPISPNTSGTSQELSTEMSDLSCMETSFTSSEATFHEEVHLEIIPEEDEQMEEPVASRTRSNSK